MSTKVAETISSSGNHNRIARASKLHLESPVICKLCHSFTYESAHKKPFFFTNFTELDEQIKLHYLTFIVEKIIKQLRKV